MYLILLLMTLGLDGDLGQPSMKVNLDDLNMQIWDTSMWEDGSRSSGNILGMDPSEQQLVLISEKGEEITRAVRATDPASILDTHRTVVEPG